MAAAWVWTVAPAAWVASLCSAARAAGQRPVSYTHLDVYKRQLYNMDEVDSMELVLKQMRATKTNNEFFDQMRRGG